MAAKNQFNHQAIIVWADVNLGSIISPNGYNFTNNEAVLVCTSTTGMKNSMKELASRYPGCNVYACRPYAMLTSKLVHGTFVSITPDGEVLPE